MSPKLFAQYQQSYDICKKRNDKKKRRIVDLGMECDSDNSETSEDEDVIYGCALEGDRNTILIQLFPPTTEPRPRPVILHRPDMGRDEIEKRNELLRKYKKTVDLRW